MHTMHAMHARAPCMPCMHTMHAHLACAPCMHTMHAPSGVCMHSAHSLPRAPCVRYTVQVGYDSPLTANAMSSLGKVKVELGFVKEGLHLLKGALKLEIAKDAFHLETVWELFSRVKDVHMEQACTCTYACMHIPSGSSSHASKTSTWSRHAHVHMHACTYSLGALLTRQRRPH